MNRRKIATILAFPLLALALACGPDDGGGIGTQPGHDPNPDKRPAPATVQPEGPKMPDPGQQPPAPAADPGCCSGKEATFTVIWVGERGGHIEYSIGGAPQPFSCPKPVKEAGAYRGKCVKTIIMVPGTTIGFTWFPDVPGMFAQCALHANGLIADYQHVQTGSCAVSWKVS